ncbi:hypothetical protein L4Y34_002094 [Pseudomonas aeruginosa]|nr:hypothetical protein [Pseudomonas aeruginosa]
MHTLYWRDLESPANGEWLGLAVQVEGAHRAPSFLHCNPAARPAFA